jgi:hypothetical protein
MVYPAKHMNKTAIVETIDLVFVLRSRIEARG